MQNGLISFNFGQIKKRTLKLKLRIRASAEFYKSVFLPTRAPIKMHSIARVKIV